MSCRGMHHLQLFPLLFDYDEEDVKQLLVHSGGEYSSFFSNDHHQLLQNKSGYHDYYTLMNGCQYL